MKAVRFHQFGGVEVLRYEDVEDPRPEPGEALVRVRACGVNHVDVDMRNGVSGFPLKLPHTLGIDVAGEVIELGPGTEGVKSGERVAVSYVITCGHCDYCRSGNDNLCRHRQLMGADRPGGYAELTTAPVRNLIPIPAGLSYDEAATALVAFSTSWHMLITKAGLRPTETVLIMAAGSSIGAPAVQIAKLAGATVIATAGSEAKLEKARELGADYTVNYSTHKVRDEVRRLTGGRGVDLVYEHVGGELFAEGVACLRRQGRLVTCGAHSGEVVPLNLIGLFRDEITLIGSMMASREEIGLMVRLIAQGKLRPILAESFPLHEAAAAHRHIEERKHFGKVFLHPYST